QAHSFNAGHITKYIADIVRPNGQQSFVSAVSCCAAKFTNAHTVDTCTRKNI
ncbi:Hypothetical predicted protein, partial [Paramuricea clavata]